MNDRTMRGLIAAAALAGAALFLGAPLSAEAPVRVSLPGTAFSPEGRGDKVVVENVAGGRRFRGQAFSELILRGVLRMPPASSAVPTVQRLVIHFRTSPSGPSLRSIELLNGSKVELRFETHLEGDYTKRETATPPIVANAWTFEPRAVGSQTVVRLKVQFPGGFDSKINPGEFFLAAVVADFPPKAKTLPATIGAKSQHPPLGTSQQAAASPALPVSSKGVIYALTSNDDLLWYRHSGQQDGTFQWATPAGKKVGNGWGFQQVFTGGDGVIYAITASHDLLWYRHDGRADGTVRWAAPEGKKIGTGWDYKQVFSGGGGVIYAVTADNDLLWFRHDGRTDGSPRWATPEGRKVGTGWDFKQIFSPGGGVIYGLTATDDLLWYRHEGREDGSFQWAEPGGRKVGTGWAVKAIFCSESPES
jgi:hypothetical protein